ncbi:MAG: hypothetical protein OEN50_06225 [Deltaproteobacteria bacterium]|nr:hypothetical protein [Deltaproteobacteria bacterium]
MKLLLTGFHVAFLFLSLLTGCALFSSGLPARGTIGGQTFESRVDSEVARYYLTSYLTGGGGDRSLDARIERVYKQFSQALPNRDELKQLSDEFSVDFAALFFADRVAAQPLGRRFRNSFEAARDYVQRALPQSRVKFPETVEDFEIVFVPGYLYRRHPATGADFAAPRKALKRVGLHYHFVETDEDGAIEANADLVLAALLARARSGRRAIIVSASKSGAEVGLALTKLGILASRQVAAWVNIVGTLQGTPLADVKLWQEMEDLIGEVSIAGVESLTTAHSRQRFRNFRVPKDIFVVNYIGIPVSGSVSSLARSGYLQLQSQGPNDGLSLLSDLILPGRLTLADLGRDHFLLDDDLDIRTLALTIAIIGWLENDQSKVLSSRQNQIGTDAAKSP